MNLSNSSDLVKHCNAINKIPILNNTRQVEILITSGVLSRDLYEQSLIYYNLAEEVYPGECDLQLYPDMMRYSSSLSTVYYNLRLIIHFPELTVTNSVNDSIVMNDFFFAMEFSLRDTRLEIGHFRGQRSTFSISEAISQYRFSHLSQLDMDHAPTFQPFCFGDGEIPLLQSRFNSSVFKEKEVFIMLLYSIQIYLQWESLEGGPYRKISDIYNYSNIWHPTMTTQTDITSYIDFIMGSNNKKKIDCDVVLKNDLYIISDNEKLNDSLVKVIVDAKLSSTTNKKLLLKKGIDGKLYLIDSEQGIYRLTTIPIIFKGKEYFYKIVDTQKQVVTEDKYTINPLIKKHVKSTLEYQLNQECVATNFTKLLEDQIEV